MSSTWSNSRELVVSSPYERHAGTETSEQKIRGQIQQVLGDKEGNVDGKRSIFYDLRDNQLLPASEKSLPRLESEGTILIMAGMSQPLVF